MNARLPLWTKLVYGSGDWSMSSFNTFRQVFYAVFLTDTVGLHPGLASLAALVGVGWDAINDPIIGILSDRVHTRFGRRRPFLMLFAVPFGLAFVGLWWAPPWESQWALALHVCLAYILTDTLQSLVTVPFLALTPELTPDYDERTSLTAYRMGFNLAASLAVAIVAPVVVDWAVVNDMSTQQGYLIAGSLFGLAGIVPPLAIALLIRERGGEPEATPPSIAETLAAAWKNRPFRVFTALYLFNWITFDLVGLMIPYFVTWSVAGGDTVATWSRFGISLPLESAMLGALLVVSLPAVPMWTTAAQYLGKRTAYIIAMLGWLVVQSAIAFVPEGNYDLSVGLAALCGIGVAAAHVLPDAMLPDVVDMDELQTGRRNEGVYYGARNLFRKGAGAIAVFVALQVLAVSGYVAGTSGAGSQPTEALWAIRTLVGPVGAVLLLAAVVCAWFYPLTRAEHADVRRQLAARAAAAPPR